MNKKIKFISILFAMSFIMTAAFAKPKNFEEVWAEKTEVSLYNKGIIVKSSMVRQRYELVLKNQGI